LADNPHRGLKRLPGSSPQLNGIEHFGKLLCRRAAHNRRSDTVADLSWSIRFGVGPRCSIRARVSLRSSAHTSGRRRAAASWSPLGGLAELPYLPGAQFLAANRIAWRSSASIIGLMDEGARQFYWGLGGAGRALPLRK
jgi:hypothetical protein